MSVDPNLIPLSKMLVETYGREQALKYALTGGDDYQLAYTAAYCEQGICIGEVVAGKSVNVLGVDIIEGGFKHF